MVLLLRATESEYLFLHIVIAIILFFWVLDIHLSICKPITPEEVGECARLVKNERFAALASIIDKRIHNSYKLHRTNYICADLVSENAEFVDYYTTAQMEEFIKYAEHSSLKCPSEAANEKLTEIFLRMYAKPVFNQLGK